MLYLSLLERQETGIMESITREVGLNTAGTGICFSLPVEHAIGVGIMLDGIDAD